MTRAISPSPLLEPTGDPASTTSATHGEGRAPMALAALNPGQPATVAAVGACTHSARRLAEMGFVRGANVEVIRAGAPCILWVDGTRLSVGGELQRTVLVALRGITTGSMP